jgi:hypothetical protein
MENHCHPDDKLRTLDQVNAYLQAHGHLPEVPSTAEVQAHGVDVEKQVLDLKAQVLGE